MRVIGFHFIVTCYGFWLPNDPRGSWSQQIRQFDLLVAGRATKINTTRSVAGTRHDRGARQAAKRLLKYPPVKLNGIQAREASRGIREAMTEHGYVLHALAMLPDHIHLVMAWHRRPVDEIAAHLKAKMTRQLNAAGCHPMAAYTSGDRTPSPWARNHWCPFVRDAAQMNAVIDYVNRNPAKAGLPAQQWSMVTPWQTR